MNVDEYVFDESYLHRLRKHDPATEEHFISYFSQRLKRTLSHAGLLPVEMEDIRQETFIRVWHAVQQGRLLHPQGFGSYVNAVCKNVLSESRRMHSRGTMDLIKPDMLTQESLEEEALKFDQTAFAQGVLAQLPERDRQLLNAHFFEQRDANDLCREFGVDRDYLRVLMHRAISKFGDLYGKLEKK